MRRISCLAAVLMATGCATAEDAAPMEAADSGKVQDAVVDTSVFTADSETADTSKPDTSKPDTSMGMDDVAPETITDSAADSVSDSGSDSASDSGSVSDVGADSPSDSAVAPSGSIAVAPAVDTPVRGGSGGGTVIDDCPPGELPTGIEIKVASAFYSGAIGAYKTFCSVSKVVATDGGLTVSLTAGSSLPASGYHGTYSYVGSPVTSSCPANQVIVGFEGSAGSWMSSIALRCAPLVISGSSVSLGTITTQTAVGSGGTSFPTTDCPVGSIARGVTVQSGEVLDAMGLRCGSPSVAP